MSALPSRSTDDRITRRDFLKLAGAATLATAVTAVGGVKDAFAQQAYPESYLINVPYHSQEVAGNYSGPACVQMILEYLNPQQVPSQRQLADEMGITSQNYVMIDAMAGTLIKRGYPKVRTQSLMVIELLKKYISHDIPLIAVISPFSTASPGAYAVVVVGYDDKSQEVIFNDPGIDGPNSRKSYQSFNEHWISLSSKSPPKSVVLIPYKGTTAIPLP